jgi:hypothetical protein
MKTLAILFVSALTIGFTSCVDKTPEEPIVDPVEVPAEVDTTVIDSVTTVTDSTVSQ